MATKKKGSKKGKKKGGYKYSRHTKAVLSRRASRQPRRHDGRFKKRK